MTFFRQIADRFESAMVAVTFAEAGEFEAARKSMQEKSRQKKTLSKQRGKTLRPLSAQ